MDYSCGIVASEDFVRVIKFQAILWFSGS